MAQDERFKKFMAHFSNEISDNFKEFVINDVLIYSRYLFVRRVTSSIQRGYCTHCKTDQIIKSSRTIKHNEDWQCEKCKSLVIVKSAGRGRGKLFDTAHVIWYEKSISNPEVITATGYNVSIDYRDDMKGVTSFVPVTRYVFEIGKATMMHRNYYFSGCFSTRVLRYENGWSFARNPFSMFGKNSYSVNAYQSLESIKNAVKDTPFRYSTWEEFSHENKDLIYFFTVFSKYPFIEYLSKMGMKKIVKCMVNKDNLYKSINLRGKTMEKILGLTKHEVKDWKVSGVIMDPLVLYTYKWFKSQGVPITWETAKKCDYLLSGTHYINILDFIQSFLSLEQIIRYVLAQMKKEPNRYRYVTGTLSTWKDYIEDCKELGMDTSKEHVLMPNSLYKAHQKTIRQVKIKVDLSLNIKIEKRLINLKKYSFEFGGFMIRPALSSIELFDEGKALDHCVGRYAKDYADGITNIFFVRKISDPNKPFFTVEIVNRKIAQVRGKKNCNPTKEVQTFIDAFTANKLSKKIKKRKIVV